VERHAINARTIDDATWQFAQERLLEQWSPEQISGHTAISPETVYQRVNADKRTGGLLWKNLRSHLVGVFCQPSGMAITNDLPSVFYWTSQMASSPISSFIRSNAKNVMARWIGAA
jgi:hypothetical protein